MGHIFQTPAAKIEKQAFSITTALYSVVGHFYKIKVFVFVKDFCSKRNAFGGGGVKRKTRINLTRGLHNQLIIPLLK